MLTSCEAFAAVLIQWADPDCEFDEFMKETARLVLETVRHDQLSVDAWKEFIGACARSSFAKKCEIHVKDLASMSFSSLAPRVGTCDIRSLHEQQVTADLLRRELPELERLVEQQLYNPKITEEHEQMLQAVLKDVQLVKAAL